VVDTRNLVEDELCGEEQEADDDRGPLLEPHEVVGQLDEG
jgi:hypothetical protein